ncbi:UPF0536 protein C12orf66 homolog [Mizuhopecten yessoensis]|uniref:KICSTOR subunit 2 n=1 Tax=Mizuhopecten yessoensis TaxID=6573 RepID=A0A210QLY6_MIZYE|nr:UPF0536 protein C12orf66 homolog [Mizuhopecten yessoensis]OWF49740.1 UPF0536 protein C12orf66 [Mizuhopecten yessoensis]
MATSNLGHLSPLSPLGAKEETFLENFFRLISQFSYEKARELADKEKDNHKAAFASSWGLFMYSLTQFATAEKGYMSLAFLEHKGFFTRSKDTLKSVYHSLAQEFRKVEDNVRNQDQLVHFGLPHPSVEFEQLIAHLCGQLGHFVLARQKTMEFYEQVCTMGTYKVLNYSELMVSISKIVQSNSRNFHHPLLSHLKSKFFYECEIMSHLLQAQVLMTELQFLPSLLQLHQAHSKLTSWGASANQPKEVKKSAFGGSSKQNPYPALYNWIFKYKQVLLSKFSLYFYELLSKQVHHSEMKTVTAKLTEDFINKIVTFQRKSDAMHVSLVLDTQGIHRCKGSGYHFPKKYSEEPKGLDSFPAIFAYPADRQVQNHWHNIVMLINNRPSDHHAYDKITCIYDKTAQSTYFITQVDVRITFVVIFECKKSEKDNFVNNFMADIRTNLNCARLYTALKPGVRV